ncbi:MAG: hypothetical protein JOZ92_05660 [Candidatus Dormibacteraeota bacterium]|nr:hypothetical protein [Candidatus Dormibacteraeota bacterium]
MGDRDAGPHPEDLPWNDEPDDPMAWAAGHEPEPAEVDGDDGEEEDRSQLPIDDSDLNRRQTLDERLRAEVPDRVRREQSRQSWQTLQEGETGEGDVEEAEPDRDAIYSEEEEDDLPAEEAAIHIVSDRDI